MKTSPLLINEPPLQVLPSLAVAIGLSEALIVQQVHYWLGRSTNERDGRLWVYRTYPEWKQEFPFWSEDTIGRIFRKLEEIGVLLATDKFNQMATDRTKWYSINYEELNRRVPQVAMLEGGKLPSSRAPQVAMLLPENTQETTTEISAGQPDGKNANNPRTWWEEETKTPMPGSVFMAQLDYRIEVHGIERVKAAVLQANKYGKAHVIPYIDTVLKDTRVGGRETEDVSGLIAAMEADINGR